MLFRGNRESLRTLLGVLRSWEQAPDERALAWVEPEGRGDLVSRGDLLESTARYASGLAALGARRGDVVVVAQPDGLAAIYAFWGALRIGAIPTLLPSSTERLDPESYRRNVRLLASHSGARMVVAGSAQAAPLAEITGCRTVTFDEVRGSAAATPPDFEASAADVAFLQHSSGTTGLQKGVALSHRSVLNQIASYSEALRLEPTDVVVSWLPLYHDMGLIAGCMLPLVQRVPLVLMSPFDWVKRPALLLRAIQEHHGTLSWLPNFAYSHCARRILDREIEGVSLARMRAFVNCSEPVLEPSQRAFVERFGRIGVRVDQLAASYAMAENVFAVTQTEIGRPPVLDVVDRGALATDGRAVPLPPGARDGATYVSCGRPIAGVTVRIDRGVPERRTGEIQIRGDCLLAGYHRRPDLDEAAFDEGWYRTGDLGYLAEGELYVVGRRKDLIIVGGRNVHPHDLEAVVGRVPGVRPGRVVAFGVQDGAEGTELIAIVAETGTEDPEARRAMAATIRKALVSETGIAASYVEIVGPKWLLKTSSGKIARGANREKWIAARKERGLGY